MSHSSGSTVLGSYVEKDLVVKLPKGNTTVPVVVNKKRVRIRNFDLGNQSLTIDEVNTELEKVKQKMIQQMDHLRYSFQVVVNLDGIGWRSSYIVNARPDKPLMYFANKYQIAGDTEADAPFDAEVVNIAIYCYGYDEKYDRTYENLDYEES
jgi:hypothetical protein